MQYESPMPSGSKVMTKVKVFVHAVNADADARAMTLPPQTYLSGLLRGRQLGYKYTSNISSFFSGRFVITTPLLNSSSGRRLSAVRRLLLSFTRLPHLSWKVSLSLEWRYKLSEPSTSALRVRSFTIWLDNWVRNSLAN